MAPPLLVWSLKKSPPQEGMAPMRSKRACCTAPHCPERKPSRRKVHSGQKRMHMAGHATTSGRAAPALATRAASVLSSASGFSTNRCRPDSNTATARSAWKIVGAATTTASMSSRARRSVAESWMATSSGSTNSSWASKLPSEAGSSARWGSATATNVARGSRWNASACVRPIKPKPMTPTRISAIGEMLSSCPPK